MEYSGIKHVFRCDSCWKYYNENNFMKTRVVILAAGKSKRMGADIPKVLLPIGERPMISHLLETVQKIGIDPRPVIVVGSGAESVKSVLANGYEYVVQDQQLGTGHAVLCAEKALRGKADAIVVLYGDNPFIQPETLRKLISLHEKSQSVGGVLRGDAGHDRPVLTMATTTVDNFEDWRKPLYDFGRIVRNSNGEIQAIVEKKDATPEELAIRELNPSFFCFKAEWLWEALKKIDNANAQKEYYLTDLVRIAIDQGKRVLTVDANPLETIGVNTPEHLELARKLVR